MIEQDRVVDVRVYTEEKEKQLKWETFANKLTSDQQALGYFRNFMNNYVGHADPRSRRIEGLPLVIEYRGDEHVAYSREICSMIAPNGMLLHIREIDEAQRWQQRQDPSYQREAIFKRGKNYFVISGNIFSTTGPIIYPVAQHDRVVVGNTQVHRLQALSPGEFNQPQPPIYQQETGLRMIEITESPGEVSARVTGYSNSLDFRHIDAQLIDLLASSIKTPKIESYALSS